MHLTAEKSARCMQIRQDCIVTDHATKPMQHVATAIFGDSTAGFYAGLW